MSEAKIIFNFEGRDITIQCSKEDKIKDICQKFATKIESYINSLIFLYGGTQMNMELKFKEQANSMDIDNKEMKVLVYKRENDGFVCPHCNTKVKLNTEKIDDIILSINNMKDTINGIKLNIDNIIKSSTNNNISIQLKNINIVLNTINEDINKNNEKLKNFLSEDNNNNNLNEINNTLINKELIYEYGRYVGQVVNGKREGKGIFYFNSGAKYEGDWKSDKLEGKGILYGNKSERYEGDFKNGKMEGKGIVYYPNGSRFEGDYKNNKREGKGIFYYDNGDREMGDWKDGKEMGKHVILSKNGEIKTQNY